MKKLAFALAAVATLGLAAPAFAANGASPAKFAQTATVKTVKPNGVAVKKTVVRQDLSARHHRHHCRTVVIKKRIGHHWVVKKLRRCR